LQRSIPADCENQIQYGARAMKPIARSEILAFEQWERVRRVLRPLCMSEKERRRLAVGSHITVLFENVQTVWYQIEEVLRAERIEKPDAVQEETDIYNRLLPAPRELAATILIEYPHQQERDTALRGLVGLERHLWLYVGEHRISAQFDDHETNAEEISAVRFVRFPMKPAHSETLVQLAGMGRLAIVVDHPTLAAQARIDVPLARVLAHDLDTSP
jgi:Protein of unknown function (DUF3501)